LISWNSIISFIIGLIGAILVEPLRQAVFGPKLELMFTTSEDYITPTQTSVYGGPDDMIFIRLRASNKRRAIAKNTRCYLVDVQRREEDGEYHPTIFCDSIPLPWSCSEYDTKYSGIDLPKGINRYVDLLAVAEGATEFVPQIQIMPFRYADLFKGIGWYRFTVQIAADGANSEKCEIEMYWGGNVAHSKII
jgi:hypothetical protein